MFESSTEKMYKVFFAYIILYLFWALLGSAGSLSSMIYNLSVLITFGITIVYAFRLRKVNVDNFLYIIFMLIWAVMSACSYQFYSNEHHPNQYFGWILEGKAIFFLNLTMLLLLTKSVDARMKVKKRTVTVLLLIVIVSSTLFLLRGVMVFPDIVRARGTATARGYGAYLLGIPSYAMIYGFTILLPLFIEYYLSKRCYMNGHERIALIVLLVSTTLMIVLSAFATATLALIVGVGTLIFLRIEPSNRIVCAIIVIPIIYLVAFTDVMSNLLYSLANALGDSTAWADKLFELALASMEDGEAVGDLATRNQYYALSWAAFTQSPLIGNLSGNVHDLGGHNTILDMLGQTGLLGTMSFLGMLITSFKNIMHFSEYSKHKAAVISCYAIFIAIIATKNTVTSFCVYVALFGLLPIFFRTYFEEVDK